MNAADIHARWRQKASSATQGEKSDRAQRLWGAGGAFGGAWLGSAAGEKGGYAWGIPRFPWGAHTDARALADEIPWRIQEVDKLDNLVRQGYRGRTALLSERKEQLARLQKDYARQVAAADAGGRRVLRAMGIGHAAGALAGGVGGYFALKHLAGLHARWRQKASSAAQEGKSDLTQRLGMAGGAVGGMWLGARVGGTVGEVWGENSYPWSAHHVERDLKRHLEIELGERRRVENRISSGEDGLTDLLARKKDRVARLRKDYFTQMGVVDAGELRARTARRLGLAAGALAGGVGGYFALKHLARPSE